MPLKHLTLRERYLINAYKHIKTQKEIANMIGVHPSTVCKELKRGAGKLDTQAYYPIAADKKAKQRQKEKSAKANLKLVGSTIEFIKTYLKKKYSPEQIAATLRLKHSTQIRK